MKIAPIVLLFLLSCQNKAQQNTTQSPQKPITMNVPQGKEIATFAGGCFWCTEAIFQNVKGVEKVTSGFTGGFIKNPAYREVCNGTTGHAEGVQIIYNPQEIAYEDLLEIFFGTHDPTTLNRQGNDVGTQYRSEIFYHSDSQKEKAEQYIKWLENEKLYTNPIVTKVSPAVAFYYAEDYHQDYYSNNSEQGYCRIIIAPKLEKLRKHYISKLK